MLPPVSIAGGCNNLTSNNSFSDRHSMISGKEHSEIDFLSMIGGGPASEAGSLQDTTQ